MYGMAGMQQLFQWFYGGKCIIMDTMTAHMEMYVKVYRNDLRRYMKI